jgi:hypothetical protein
VKIRKEFLSIYFFIIGLAFSYSQVKPTYLSIGLNFSDKINTETFDNYWNSSPAIGIDFSFKENFGELGFGISLAKFGKKTVSTESFYAVEYFLSYRNSIEIFSDLYLIPQLNIGICEFRFYELDLETTNDAGEVEREFFIKYLLGLSYLINQEIQVELLPSFQKIYTHKRIDLFRIEAGIKYWFKSPVWLEEFFS